MTTTQWMSTYAGEGWRNGFIPQQDLPFQARFGLWPGSEVPLDGVFGLSYGPADGFTDLAAIVRLNPDGYVDVRDGSAYRADVPFTYEPGLPVNVTMRIDLPNRVYDVDVTNWDFANQVPLARGYAFRTEQSAMTRIDNFGRIIDSPTGTVGVTGFTIDSQYACTFAYSGGGWNSRSFYERSGHFRAAFVAYASDHNMDAVIGLSNGGPTGFRSLGPIVRFNDQGYLDARDGDVYRADTAVSYADWRAFYVVMDIDVSTHTYSVDIGYPSEKTIYATLARNYRFRTEQANVPVLDVLGDFVDSSFGTVYFCDMTIDYS
jgi:unsaturated chondroitin disaccharide hydrolase